MSRVNDPILANLTLKNKILKDLVREYNISDEVINEYPNLFENYANIKLELFMYNSVIPYKKLEIYRHLKNLEANFFLVLHKILNEEENINKI